MLDHALPLTEELTFDRIGAACGVHMVEVEALLVDDGVGLHQELFQGNEVLIDRELTLGGCRLVVLPAVCEEQVHVRRVEQLAELSDCEVTRRRQHLLLALGQTAEGQKPEIGSEGKQLAVD